MERAKNCQLWICEWWERGGRTIEPSNQQTYQNEEGCETNSEYGLMSLPRVSSRSQHTANHQLLHKCCLVFFQSRPAECTAGTHPFALYPFWLINGIIAFSCWCALNDHMIQTTFQNALMARTTVYVLRIGIVQLYAWCTKKWNFSWWWNSLILFRWS